MFGCVCKAHKGSVWYPVMGVIPLPVTTLIPELTQVLQACMCCVGVGVGFHDDGNVKLHQSLLPYTLRGVLWAVHQITHTDVTVHMAVALRG